MASDFGFHGESGKVGEERADRWVPLGSEREGKSSGAGLVSGGCWAVAWFGPRVRPSWAGALLFSFLFVLFPFSYFLIFCFRF
jgi:hypothetical protein